MTAPAKSDTHVLYRFYDADDVLLYVGITMDPPTRFRDHRMTKDWWGEVSRIEVETHSSRAALAVAEREAIRSEVPLHNIVHSTRKHGAVPPMTRKQREEMGRKIAEIKAETARLQAEADIAEGRAAALGVEVERLRSELYRRMDAGWRPGMAWPVPEMAVEA